MTSYPSRSRLYEITCAYARSSSINKSRGRGGPAEKSAGEDGAGSPGKLLSLSTGKGVRVVGPMARYLPGRENREASRREAQAHLQAGDFPMESYRRSV